MTAPPIPDAENAHRVWLRGKIPTVAGRVVFAFPDGANPLAEERPALITVRRIGGAPQRGQAPLDDVRLSYEVWALNKKDAADAMTALVALLRESAGIQLDDGTYLYGVQVESIAWVPDDAAKLARYVVTATSTVR